MQKDKSLRGPRYPCSIQQRYRLQLTSLMRCDSPVLKLRPELRYPCSNHTLNDCQCLPPSKVRSLSQPRQPCNNLPTVAVQSERSPMSPEEQVLKLRPKPRFPASPTTPESIKSDTFRRIHVAFPSRSNLKVSLQHPRSIILSNDRLRAQSIETSRS